ncbi:MAG: arginine repressor [Lachnospiraceae bacterium]|nr:arginine repressor [Lachnospiraceae bacterium]
MKIGRQAKIVELVNANDIETQEELADLLNAAGYNVTQATISRDIRELKLTKVPTEKGRQKYAVLKQAADGMFEKYVQVLKNGFLSMDCAQNILVIKTVAGMAMAVGAAIDHLNMNGVIGCIAGDDTVFCAIRTTDDTLEVMKKIAKLVEE